MGRLRTREIFVDSRYTVIAVESVHLRCRKQDTSCQLYASIKPIAVIVRSPDGTYALDIEANPTDITRLEHVAGGLNAVSRD